MSVRRREIARVGWGWCGVAEVVLVVVACVGIVKTVE